MNKYYSQMRSEMLPFVPSVSKMILEYGCADGTFGAELKKRNSAVVWGIEIDLDAAQIASRRLDRVIVSKESDAIFAELSSHYFDCIIFNDVLEHIAKPEEILDAAKKILATDGVLVGSIPNVRYFPVLLDLFWNADWKYSDFGVLDRTHLRFFTEISLRRLFKDTGFEVIKFQGINPTTGIRARLWSLVTFGKFRDCIFQQYAFVLKIVP